MAVSSRLDRILDRLPFAHEDRAKALTGLGLAVLTVLATMVAALQTDAGIRAQRGKRDADRSALEAAGREGGALLRVGTGYAVWRRWFEQVERSNSARDAAQADPDRDDTQVLEALAEIDLELSEWVRGRSELLQPPYFDEDGSGSDFTRYEADVEFEPRVRAQELHDVEAAVATAWDTRTSTYLTILTIVAVALFFLGLGSQLRRPARGFLAAAGVLLGLLALGWTTVEAFTVIHRVPDDAVVRVAQARRETLLAYAPTSGTITPEQEAGLRRAVTLADEALAIDPTFTSAHRTRAEARLVHGEALRLAHGPGPAVDELTRAAVSDYRMALEGDDDRFITWANLGWAAFLAGDATTARSATDQAIDLVPDHATLHVQRAMIRAFTGESDGARADVETGLAVAADIASDSGAYQLALATYLMRRLAEQDAARAALLMELEQRIREAQVAIAVLDEPRAAPDAPALDVDGMVALRVAPDGSLAEGLPIVDGQETVDPDAVGYRVRVRARAGAEGRTLSARVARDGFDEPSYDVDVEWPTGESSAAIDLLTPYGRAGFWVDAGAFELRLYLDAASRSSVRWRVPADRGPALEGSPEGLLASLEQTGMGCTSSAPVEDAEQLRTTCETSTSSRTFRAELTEGGDGRLVRLLLEAEAVDGASIEADARRYFEVALLELYGQERGAELVDWLAGRHERFGQVRMLGTYVRTFGEGDTRRSLEILP
jgi:tetratricopeptide (TPR) repeat protein